MLAPTPNQAAAAPASVDAGFDATPVTATVNPAPATVETGFGELDGTPATVRQAAPTGNTVAGAGDDQDVDLDARAAALLPRYSLTDWNAISAFMAAVVPWPGSLQDPGYVNLQCSIPDPKDPAKVVVTHGWPFRTVDSIISRASWANTTTQFKDAWFCLSLQSTTRLNPNGSGKVQAVRKAMNALAVKSLWIDVDVGKKDGYATIQDALKAVIEFKDAVGLPPFSAIVGSGSGVHIYWISDKALTPAEWKTYAEGLKALLLKHGVKCDAGLTTDIARILRFPGTFNHKTNPAKPVQLFPLPLKLYDFATQLAILPTVAPLHTSSTQSTAASSSPFAPGADMSTFQKPAFTVAGPGLGAGIDIHSDQLLKAEPILKQCGFFSHALKTGGADYANPLWNLSVLCSTFMENGNAIAHALSKGHATYSEDGTQTLYDRKLAERADRGLGYPSCSTIQSNGCKSCSACPFLNKIKSPLNLANPKPLNGQSSKADQSASSQYSALPSGDWVDPLDFDEVPLAEAVARINAAGYFVLTQNGDIYKQSSSGGVVVQKREGFTNLFACRKASLDDDKAINAGTAWKTSSQRREYDSIGYWPSDHDRADKSYNLWLGWGVEPKEGDWSIIHHLILDVIANGDLGKADFILNWLAHMVQRPWEKPGVALVLRGRKGTGKSLLVGIVARAIGKSNTLTTANGKSLFGTFNWHLADKLLICAEEAFFAGNREQNDQLKHLLTGADIEVEQKFGQRLVMKSMHRLMMTSNHNQVVAASDDERRYQVNDVSDKRKGDDLYFAPLVRVLNGENEAPLAAFMYELTTRDIRGWKAEQAARNIATDDLARQKLLSLEPPLQWLLEQAQMGPGAGATMQTIEDTAPPDASDVELDHHIAGRSEDKPQGSGGAARAQERADVLRDYRYWAKNSQVRGAADYNGSENFWLSIKRLLNNEIFPGRRLFRNSGGTRFVVWPSQQELIDGFNQLLGGRVVGDNARDE